MAKPMRSFPAVFMVAVCLSVMASAVTPTLHCLRHHEAMGLSSFDQEDAALSSDIPDETLPLRPRLQGVAGRIHRTTGMDLAVVGDPAPRMQVPSARKITIYATGRFGIDDPKVLTQSSPRGPPSV